jgi:hypothetical protein
MHFLISMIASKRFKDFRKKTLKSFYPSQKIRIFVYTTARFSRKQRDPGRLHKYQNRPKIDRFVRSYLKIS